MPTLKFKPTWKNRVLKHGDAHWKTKQRYRGKLGLRFSLDCRKEAHYHCPECQETLLRKCALVAQQECEEPPSKRAKVDKKSCVHVCSKEVLASNMLCHKKRKHQTQGIYNYRHIMVVCKLYM